MRPNLHRLVRSRRGVSAMEYAIIASLASIAMAIALIGFGTAFSEPAEEVTDALAGSASSSGGSDALADDYSTYDADGSGDMDYYEWRDYIRSLVAAGDLTHSEGVAMKTKFYTEHCWSCTITVSEFKSLLSS